MWWLQITEDGMVGGVFGVNTRGLEHYAHFGHHGVLAPAAEALDEDWAADTHWVKVDYQPCRAILFDGSLPHRATTTRALPVGLRRVVVGINVFDSSVGSTVARAPVHSQAYRDAMAELQSFRRLCAPAHTPARDAQHAHLAAVISLSSPCHLPAVISQLSSLSCHLPSSPLLA